MLFFFFAGAGAGEVAGGDDSGVGVNVGEGVAGEEWPEAEMPEVGMRKVES